MAAGAMAVGTAYQAYYQYQSAKIQRKMHELNAELYEKEAEYIEVTGEWAVEDKKKEIESYLAAQKARAGASGLDVYSGSYMQVQMETVEQGATDVYRLRQQTAYDAAMARVGAGQQRAYGHLAMAEGWASTGQTVMQGASAIGSAYSGYLSGTQGTTGGDVQVSQTE